MKSRRIVIRHSRKRKEPVLWVIDAEQWPRACLRAELIERGYDPYGFITVADALDSLARDELSKPELIVLELRGQHLTDESIEAILNLGVHTIVIYGNSELNDPFLKKHNCPVAMKRPVSLGQIADAVQILVPANHDSE